MNSTQKIYRSYITTIIYRYDEWLYRNKYLSIEIDKCSNKLYFDKIFTNNGSQLGGADLNGITVQCKNGISISLTMAAIEFQMKSKSLTTISQHENKPSLLNPNVYELNIKINWPNGLHIMATCRNSIGMDNNSETLVVVLQVVEQVWLNKQDSGELKRIYYSNGSVVVYYDDERIKCFTSNGMIYESFEWENEQEILEGRFLFINLNSTNYTARQNRLHFFAW